ncbi:MAG: exonuclease domain-containing protein, partial [Clostridium sp.]
EENKNIKIKHFKYSNSIINNFLNKHIKNQKKRKLKETKKLSDVINIYENVVFFDLEMNYGLKGGKNINETISIGAIKYNRNFNYQEKERFYSFIKPIYNVKLNEKIIELTKIKQEEIDNAKDFNSVMNDFYNWVGHERTIFVSWGLADLRILNSDNENNGEDLEIVHTIKENYVDFQEEFCEFMKSKNSISLLNGLKEYNIKFNGIQHNPLDDAVNLKELAIKFIDAHKKVKV